MAGEYFIPYMFLYKSDILHRLVKILHYTNRVLTQGVFEPMVGHL